MPDVVVIGAGPAGAACAHRLAAAGLDVVLLERDRFPRDKPCGDALTPMALEELHLMGLEDALDPFHTTTHLRFRARGRAVAVPWRAHPAFVGYGKVVRRSVLDSMVANAAAKAGALLIEDFAVSTVERRGATWQIRSETDELAARAIVLADGARSPLAASLGLQRDADLPLGLAMRGYYESVCHDDPHLEIEMGLPGPRGPIAGYGWVFPVGDGTVNVGVGYLSTARLQRALNLQSLLADYVALCEDRWGLVGRNPCERPRAGRLPMGGSISPIASSGFAACGDAGGLNNPFVGEGIGFAYRTGRLAAEALIDAHNRGEPASTSAYAARVEHDYARFFHLGNIFATLIGWPNVMSAATGLGVRVPPLMRLLIPVMNHSVVENGSSVVDRASRAATLGAQFVPRRTFRLLSSTRPAGQRPR